MSRMFGTDGVRGIANSPELSPELAFRLGRAGAFFLTRTASPGTGRPRLIVGMDTRISGPMLEAALVAGICSVGVDAVRVEVVTTPAVAFLVPHLGAQGGVMISASHNPVEYNGIKFFSATGHKLPDAVEEEIEAIVRAEADHLPNPTGADVGRITDQPELAESYVEHVVASVTGPGASGPAARPWQGLKLVVDCAEGAAYRLAPEVYRRLGAEVVVLHDRPDGLNINVQCGSTHPESMQAAVPAQGAHVGIAHDGDADRVLLADERGGLIDGDHILAICGLELLRSGRLHGNAVAATVLSNMGLELALRQAGGSLVRTKVGDRYVLEAMLQDSLVLGGEQSGHVIFLDHSTTGDGILTACQTIKILTESGKPLSALAAQMDTLPQVAVNVRVPRRDEAATNPAIQAAVANAEASLQGEGRVLVRPSGTEPLVRIMAEGRDETKLRQVASLLETVIRAELA